MFGAFVLIGRRVYTLTQTDNLTNNPHVQQFAVLSHRMTDFRFKVKVKI